MKTIFAWTVVFAAAWSPAGAADLGSWDGKAAAAYLDQRANWWMGWKSAARDHDTFCVSCHTALPYALGRPALRSAMGEQGPSADEQKLIANVSKRVAIWNDALPFYSDEKNGAPKTAEARGTEAVLNVVILASYDARRNKLSESGRQAFANMWALQLKSGDAQGAWTWLNFQNEPWEAQDSQFWGATLAALAVGMAPENYRSSPEIAGNVKALAEYLRKSAANQSLLNRVYLLWASAKMPALMSAEDRSGLIDQLFAKVGSDGGWSSSALVLKGWERKDGTPLETASDGYATGLVTYAFEQAGVSRDRLQRPLAWLSANQDKSTGLWPAWSLNKKREPESDAGRFMSDAATAFSVLALTY